MFHPLIAGLVRTLNPLTSVCEFGNQRYGGDGDFKSTRAFYESLGCTRYLAIDVNEHMDAIVADLNEPVELGETFDLVTNNGTGEHIFDQRSVFENAHNLSHRHMVHVLPFTPWINHGFFNYNPILFRDLAAANNYRADVYIADRWGQEIRVEPVELYREKRPNALIRSAAAFQNDVFVVAIFEKRHDEAFRLPFQGKYQRDIEDDGLRRRYQPATQAG